MAEIHNLNDAGTPAEGTYFIADNGNDTGKLDYAVLARAILEAYAGTTMGGSAQTVKQAVNAAERSANKVTAIGASSTDEAYPSAKAVWTLCQALEQAANKVTTIGASSTNETYPSAKAVWDLIMSLDGEEESY